MVPFSSFNDAVTCNQPMIVGMGRGILGGRRFTKPNAMRITPGPLMLKLTLSNAKPRLILLRVPEAIILIVDWSNMYKSKSVQTDPVGSFQ
eukprot:CAMPEP_0184371312 /NCGR_PEP_ID=MMETSP1089-20130417/163332_1 /TAXON_ID=38269 ORGANISM="Gloeochaete wittrockiana, Strain SAG46.84" /NCGR_SAMPLE_ID=MMETSP1089 /ASSEMBLY_ACC=CAM_ASM_000445 /LENGTH=90 /DNA_ID=CAMNT_0026714057 /DNA_START=736 /DNA_END=1008 /DNA_ORIENTATION=+